MLAADKPMKTLHPAGTETEVIAELERYMPGWRPITQDSAPWHDLRIGGDDAWEFLEEIVDRYRVSFEGMQFHELLPSQPRKWPPSGDWQSGWEAPKQSVDVLPFVTFWL